MFDMIKMRKLFVQKNNNFCYFFKTIEICQKEWVVSSAVHFNDHTKVNKALKQHAIKTK